MAEAKIRAPALIVVGEVVRLHDTINWFETKPLFGKRVVVTRAREQASDLKRLFEESGAQVVQFPTIEIVAAGVVRRRSTAPSTRRADLADLHLDERREVLLRAPAREGEGRRVRWSCKVAAVGDTTAAELRARGIAPDLVPDKFSRSALLPLLPADQHGVARPSSAPQEGRDELIDELRKRGGEVDLAVAYRTRRRSTARRRRAPTTSTW